MARCKPAAPTSPHSIPSPSTAIVLHTDPLENDEQLAASCAFFSFSRDWKCPARVDRKLSWENRKIFSYTIDALDVFIFITAYYAPLGRGIKQWCCLMSVAYIMHIHGAHSYWKQGALGATGIRRVWAGARPQRAAYREGRRHIFRPRT